MSITLRTYFVVIFSIFTVGLTTFLSFTISRESGEEVKQQIGERLANDSYQIADKLDQFMWSRFGEITVLSKLEVFQDANSTESIRTLINELKTNFPAFSWIGFLDAKGTVKASTDQILEGEDLTKRPVYYEALTETFIGDVHEAVLLADLLPNESGEPLKFVDISAPIFNPNGDFVGVLATHLSWEWAKQVKESVVRPLQQQDNQLEVFIVSKRENTVLLGPEELIGKPLNIQAVENAQKNENNWSIEKWPDGKYYVTGYALADGFLNYPGLDWTVIMRQPEAIAFYSVLELKQTILSLGFLSTVLFAVMGWFLAGYISNPLKQIAFTADRLKKGEKVEIPIKKGIRDIEILSTSLKHLIETLGKTESDLGKMEEIAHQDKLTGLPNRLALDLFMEEAASYVKGTNQGLLFLYLDLDGFKTVNDTLGHHHGDLLLKEVATRIKRSLRSHEFVCRLSGDEFLIVLKSSAENGQMDGEIIGNRVIEAIQEPFKIETDTVTISCSIGASLWTNHDLDPYTSIRNADKALYTSKESGKNKLTFHHKD
ncbi:sensor domain-containing diguanylate cyclase [Bacillus pinisoli]|uniref:sensor domain-containing diguanylate cyclase n=1 Tax=Bacillus pinisoli TaxID=2901866 RepID=UPI001FF64887|nr:diguanylate cyclase [Bacillus pinisoli]